MICSQISIFEPLKTTSYLNFRPLQLLWFALKLVSLNHWKQRRHLNSGGRHVVICSQISIFEPLKTTYTTCVYINIELWFALKLVSLNHWKQLVNGISFYILVVICSQISIFEPLKTTALSDSTKQHKLWFALKLVSLNHWKQRINEKFSVFQRCDLLSN